jgi:TetR/AcrR family transcriptional regulator
VATERKLKLKEARKQLIINAAWKLFDEKGFETTTVDEIAEAAELSKGTIYNYFASKYDILGTIQLDNMAVLHEWFERAASGVEDPRDRLRVLGMTFIKYIREKLSATYTMFVLQNNTETMEVSETLRIEIKTKVHDILGFIQDAIKDGIQRGYFRSDIDPLKMGVAFWGTAIGIHALTEKLRPEFPPEFTDSVYEEIFKVLPKGMT